MTWFSNSQSGAPQRTSGRVGSSGGLGEGEGYGEILPRVHVARHNRSMRPPPMPPIQDDHQARWRSWQRRQALWGIELLVRCIGTVWWRRICARLPGASPKRSEGSDHKLADELRLRLGTDGARHEVVDQARTLEHIRDLPHVRKIDVCSHLGQPLLYLVHLDRPSDDLMAVIRDLAAPGLVRFVSGNRSG